MVLSFRTTGVDRPASSFARFLASSRSLFDRFCLLVCLSSFFSLSWSSFGSLFFLLDFLFTVLFPLLISSWDWSSIVALYFQFRLLPFSPLFLSLATITTIIFVCLSVSFSAHSSRSVLYPTPPSFFTQSNFAAFFFIFFFSLPSSTNTLFLLFFPISTPLFFRPSHNRPSVFASLCYVRYPASLFSCFCATWFPYLHSSPSSPFFITQTI